MNPHQRVSSPASQPSVRSRLVWFLALLSALVPREQVRERQRRVVQGAGVLLLYGLALSALLIWALLQWR